MRRPKAVACCSQPDTLTQRRSLLRRHATAANEPVSVMSTSEADAVTLDRCVRRVRSFPPASCKPERVGGGCRCSSSRYRNNCRRPSCHRYSRHRLQRRRLHHNRIAARRSRGWSFRSGCSRPMQSEPGPSVQRQVRHDRRHGRRQAPLDRRVDQFQRRAEEPDPRSRHGAHRPAPWEVDLRMREDLRPRSAEDRPAPWEEDRGIAQTPQSAPMRSLRASR